MLSLAEFDEKMQTAIMSRVFYLLPDYKDKNDAVFPMVHIDYCEEKKKFDIVLYKARIDYFDREYMKPLYVEDFVCAENNIQLSIKLTDSVKYDNKISEELVKQILERAKETIIVSEEYRFEQLQKLNEKSKKIRKR